MAGGENRLSARAENPAGWRLRGKDPRRASRRATSFPLLSHRRYTSVVAELVAREQPEPLRAYFMERLQYYRQLSAQLPDKNAPEYARKEDEIKK
ncbi:hypothetical protein FTS55_15935 [Salmonella enterica subsp. enterica]|nr:hypothetical protein [Salmonella enterica subsp. enterica serovar Menston]